MNSIWETLAERMPSGVVFFCAFLTVAIPLTIHKINKKMHKMGDPPWKKEEQK